MREAVLPNMPFADPESEIYLLNTTVIMASGDASILPLPGFKWGEGYEKAFYDALWSHNSDGGLTEPEREPPGLLQLIETLKPDDTWLPSNPIEEDTMVDSLNGSKGKGDGDSQPQSDESEGNSPVRFIDLSKYPALDIQPLTLERMNHPSCPTFIVRDEYRVFMKQVISRFATNNIARFFLTGQPGIGKSFGMLYMLMYLLASGQSVFFITFKTAYFSSDGVQFTEAGLKSDHEVVNAFRKSWILIDYRNWTPSPIVQGAHCIIWTGSLQEPAMKGFMKDFLAQRWFMAAWTNKEIAAARERYEIPRKDIQEKLNTGGPVARYLFDGQAPTTPEALRRNIDRVLADNPFSFALPDKDGFGQQPSHRVYLIQPLLKFDEASGQMFFERAEFRVEFLSAYIADEMCKRADVDKLQGQLAAAIDTYTSRSVAGRLFERIMHRALADHTVRVPSIFGRAYIAGTLQLIGKATNFSSEPKPESNNRPLYLQPKDLNFGAVDAVLVTKKKLGLIQTSGKTYVRDFGTMLRIIARMPRGANIEVDQFDDVLYCLVGANRRHVEKLVREAKSILEELKLLDSHELCKKVGVEHTHVGHRRLSTFSVVGYTFHHRQGFTSISRTSCRRRIQRVLTIPRGKILIDD